MLNNVIIHISDLHLSLHLTKDDKRENVKFWLSTDEADENNNYFLSNFCLFINETYKESKKYLIITGDICNQAIKSEFDFASRYLKNIITELNIEQKNILIVPGDHDVNWQDCTVAFNDSRLDNPSKKAHEYQSEKLEKFSVFYKEILNKDFIATHNVIDQLVIDEIKTVFVGLNSNYLIEEGGGLGALDISTLKSELEIVEKKYSQYSKIAVTHHNLFAQYEKSHKGQWDQNNRIFTLNVLQSMNYKGVLYGNEHTYSSKFHDEYKLYAIDSGSLTSKSKPNPSFFVFESKIETNQDVKLQVNLFVCENNGRNNKYEFGSWIRHNIKDYGDKETIELVTSNVTVSESNISLALPDVATSQEITELLESKKNSASKSYENSIFSEKLYNVIKEKKLFHSGHFHWSETSRAHNWIDVSKILENNEHLLLAKKAIVDVVEKCDLNDKFDFIIGLGTEGNIISTRTVIRTNKPYSYLPYSYRYDEHNEFEQKLNFNAGSDFKNVLIITDVVNDGRTIRKLIGKREKNFFETIENVYVISLFYTGEEKNVHSGILNHCNIKNFDVENDEVVNNIEFYSVLNIKVEKCPYGKEYKSDCLIYKDNLDCVHLFYDERKTSLNQI